jgi:hypothetical protein
MSEYIRLKYAAVRIRSAFIRDKAAKRRSNSQLAIWRARRNVQPERWADGRDSFCALPGLENDHGSAFVGVTSRSLPVRAAKYSKIEMYSISIEDSSRTKRSCVLIVATLTICTEEQPARHLPS